MGQQPMTWIWAAKQNYPAHRPFTKCSSCMVRQVVLYYTNQPFLHRGTTYEKPHHGLSLLKNFRGQSLLFAFWWCHHVQSTIARPFVKLANWGHLWNWNNLVTMAPHAYAHCGGIATSNIYKYTMVLYLNIQQLALYLIQKYTNSEIWA